VRSAQSLQRIDEPSAQLPLPSLGCLQLPHSAKFFHRKTLSNFDHSSGGFPSKLVIEGAPDNLGQVVDAKMLSSLTMNTANLLQKILSLRTSLGKLRVLAEIELRRRLVAQTRWSARGRRQRARAQRVGCLVSKLSRRLKRSVGRVNPFVVVFFLGLLAYEVRTSTLQSLCLWYLAGNMTYSLEPRSSSSVVFPKTGPFNERLGYTRIGAFQQRLQHSSFTVTYQTRFSPLLQAIAQLGINPPYRELPLVGLRISGADLAPLTEGSESDGSFRSYEEIPTLLVKSLLFIENRELENPPDVRTNPVWEWDRMAKAAVLYTGNKLGLPIPLEGGSTLVTQLEKYRYSAEGRTLSGFDKVRQLVSASLKVYRSGVDTRRVRHEIILDYLNTMPLSAAPGHGEVNGLGEGLQVWFGESLKDACRALEGQSGSLRKAAAYRRMLTLLAAVRAPSYYLRDNRLALEQRVLRYARLLRQAGIIDSQSAMLLEQTSPKFSSSTSRPLAAFSPQRKGVNAVRNRLARLLRTSNLYELDRLNLEVETTLDVALQNAVAQTFDSLKKKEFLAAHGFLQQRLLDRGDPGNVIYALTLFERTSQGNLLRAQVDTYQNPLDFNQGIKLELGSTAKLRTLAHYLELVASLYEEFTSGKDNVPHKDVITEFVSEILAGNPNCRLEDLLRMALDRKYSGSPYETFLTGGGLHVFRNYDSTQDERRMSVREATIHSNNLVFVRLMRDLVRFHQARLEYDPAQVLADRGHPARVRLLQMGADDEARQILWRTFKECRSQPQESVLKCLLGKRSKSNRQLAILFFGLQGDRVLGTDLSSWLESKGQRSTTEELSRWTKAYRSPSLSLLDYAYLLDVHPLSLWCAGQLLGDPLLSWQQIWERSSESRKLSTAWLFEKRQWRAQNLRLSIRIERDAFARMTPAWRRLGFPYEHLVPSLAAAIGNSGDRPEALAELMGIILNEGQLQPAIEFSTLHFAPQTPYQTLFAPARRAPSQAMHREVAGALKSVLIGVVKEGTGRRLAGAFTGTGGRIATVGGKTGTGDNRFKSYGSSRALVSSRAINRTASFVFFIEDRYFGVVSASVLGREADQYAFTSALPVAILKLLAPTFNARLHAPAQPQTHEVPYLQTQWPGSPVTRLAMANSASPSPTLPSYGTQDPRPQDSPPLDTRINLCALPVDPSNLRWRRWSALVA